MKIEIELHEVERLKSLIHEQESQIQEMREKLEEIDEEELIQRAINLSKKLLKGYMATVFENLGFDVNEDNSVIFQDNLEYFLGKEWRKSGRVKVDVGANICNEFRRAYLKIGVIPKEEIKEDKSDTFELKG